MNDGPFTIVSESVDTDDWNNPNAIWERSTRTYATEKEAVHVWGCLRRYANTRPISITPDPDWSRYSYDGRTPVTKW
jgi:hypothetical protein